MIRLIKIVCGFILFLIEKFMEMPFIQWVIGFTLTLEKISSLEKFLKVLTRTSEYKDDPRYDKSCEDFPRRNDYD